jgi:hypothetical protein
MYSHRRNAAHIYTFISHCRWAYEAILVVASQIPLLRTE